MFPFGLQQKIILIGLKAKSKKLMMYRKKPMEEKLPWNLFWQNKQKLPYKSTCNTLIRMGVFPLCCCYFFLLCFDLLLAFFTVIFLFHYLCTILYCWPLLACFCVHVSISLRGASPYCDVLISKLSYPKPSLSLMPSISYPLFWITPFAMILFTSPVSFIL